MPKIITAVERRRLTKKYETRAKKLASTHYNEQLLGKEELYIRPKDFTIVWCVYTKSYWNALLLTELHPEIRYELIGDLEKDGVKIDLFNKVTTTFVQGAG